MSSTSGSTHKKRMTAPMKHQKVVLPSTCTGENALVLDFSPFETILQWKRMPECDIFVGARYLIVNLYLISMECQLIHCRKFSDEASIRLLPTKMQFMFSVEIMAKVC